MKTVASQDIFLKKNVMSRRVAQTSTVDKQRVFTPLC